MIVKTHWPALVPAIVKAGHEPVLVPPLEFFEGPVEVRSVRDGDHEFLIISHPSAPPVKIEVAG